MKKLSNSQINKINGNSEIDNNKFINETLGLDTKMNFDIWKDGCFLVEAKLDIRSQNNGLKKAQKELSIYSEKLKLAGMKLPKNKFILDYETMSIYDEYGELICKLREFNWDIPENYENFDITFENGPNVAQQIYSRHPKIKDSNIFDYFKSGIDWYNSTNLSQTDFRMVLDLFNDPQTQKKRGAFYTPDEYINFSTKYLRDAIKKVPKGRDYIILDRCAGSGQLEKFLNEEELSHCVLSTIGIAEWIALWNIYGGKARTIIPPYINGKVINQNTKPEELKNQLDFFKNEVNGADALTSDFYKNNRHLWEGKYIIVLENPPYADATSNMHKKATKNESNKTWVKTQMKGIGAAANDLYTQFVWSAWNIVKCDEYIVYGPIKQWKLNNFLTKKFNVGYLCNRKKFHATESAISLAWYSNKDIIQNEVRYSSDIGERICKKITSKWNLFEDHNIKLPILAKMVAQGGNRNMAGAMLLSPNNKATSHVKYIDIDIDNLLFNLPLFVANFWADEDYTSKGVIMKSADGGKKYQHDDVFLTACANWTYFSNKTKCEKEDKIWEAIKTNINLDDKLLLVANNILKYANIKKWIGLDNIDKEYNLKIENKYGQMVPQNSKLDIQIKELKNILSDFYKKHIAPKLFDYQLLK